MLEAQGILDGLRKESAVDMSYWICGGRYKHNELDETERKKLKARLILMQERIPFIVGSHGGQVLTKMLQRNNDGPLFIGYNKTGDGYKRVVEGFGNFEKVYCGDWKGFDGRMVNKIVLRAFSIFGATFINNESDYEYVRNYIWYVASSFIRKNILFAGGELYVLSRGIPSGHSWTTLIGSLCNWLMLKYILRRIYPQEVVKKFKIGVSGDDHIVGIGDKSLSEEELCVQMTLVSEKELCCKLKQSAIRFGNVYAVREEDGVLFLGNVYICMDV
jgi:hypothetical protein